MAMMGMAMQGFAAENIRVTGAPQASVDGQTLTATSPSTPTTRTLRGPLLCHNQAHSDKSERHSRLKLREVLQVVFLKGV